MQPFEHPLVPPPDQEPGDEDDGTDDEPEFVRPASVLRRTALDRKLERLELEHLRRFVVALRAELDAAIDRAEYAESSAEHWHRELLSIQDHLADTHCVGLSVSGQLSIVEREQLRQQTNS